MRDPMDEQVHLLAVELGRVEWPDGDEIRGIARRRTRRSALAASLSVLLLLSGVWVAAMRPFEPPPERADLYGVAAGPEPMPVATTIGPRDPAWIPPEALLSPEDIGKGLVTTWTLADQDQPVGSWAFTLSPCPEYPKVRTYEGGYQFRRQQTVGYPPKVAGRPEMATVVLHQTVMRLSGSGARQLVDEAAEAVTVCPKYLSVLADVSVPAVKAAAVRATHAWTLVAEDFAGDDSLLFEHRMTALTRDGYADLGASAVVIVRVGDLVTTVEQVQGGNPASARQLGGRAATWLCTAATPPC